MIFAWSLSAALLAVLIGVMLHSRRLYSRVVAAREVRERLMRELADEQKSCAASTAKFDTFLEATADSVLSVDSSGWCHLLNQPALDLFGVTTVPQTLLTATQCAELDELLKTSRSKPDSGEPVRGEVILHAFQGRIMQVLICRSLMAGMAPPEHLILLRDITNLRRLETMRRDFVANVSHELRTPLSSVMAMTETLLDGALEDEEVARHFLRTIMRETDRLVRLTADLLDLSRAETRPVSRSESNIAALIRDVAGRLSSQTAKASITMTIEVPEHLTVECDEDEIGQVLMNLIENAVKYTPREGSVTITARMQETQIEVEVADTGIGILHQDLPRLFERFYRVDKARSRQSGGTGLGLSIVKHIIERHHGGLWVRSEYNHGTVFGFSLPKLNTVSASTTIPPLNAAQIVRHPGNYYEYLAVSSQSNADIVGDVSPATLVH